MAGTDRVDIELLAQLNVRNHGIQRHRPARASVELVAVYASEDQSLSVEQENRVGNLETSEAHTLIHLLHGALFIRKGQRQRVEGRRLRAPWAHVRQPRIQVKALGARETIVSPDNLPVRGTQLCGDHRGFECTLDVNGDGEYALSGCRIVVCVRLKVFHVDCGQRYEGDGAEKAVKAPGVLALEP